MIMMVTTGEMEATLTRTFIMAARLRSWVSRPDSPRYCKDLFDKLYPRDNISDLEPSDHDYVHDPGHPISIDHSDVTEVARVRYGGLVFARSSCHLGNSLIKFYCGGDKGVPPVVGQIKAIYCQGGNFILVVQRQLAASPGTPDPFQDYPHLELKIYSAVLADEEEQIPLEWVFSHVARYPMSSDLVVIASLSGNSHNASYIFNLLI